MDVGLNNRNTLGKEAPELADVVFLVEATSNEKFNLWQEWSDDSMFDVKPLSKNTIECLNEAAKSWPVLRSVFDLNSKIEHNQHPRIKWEQVNVGRMLTIGHINIDNEKLPVNIEFSFAIIKGKKICFYNCCSRVADYTMIKNWLIKRFQLTHDKYSRWNHTDAANFHNCVQSLDNLDKKPRNTKYKITK